METQHIKAAGCMVTMDRKFICIINNTFTGEVFKHFVGVMKIGEVVFTGYCKHELEGLPVGENGLSKLFCRVLAEATMDQVEEVWRKIPKHERMPLLLGRWYRVHYD